MLINSPNCSTCLFSWYLLLIMVGGVGGDVSQNWLLKHLGSFGKPQESRSAFLLAYLV